MANYRQIHVSIWKDEWFLELDADEKLLFIYLFSNELASLAGIYKIPLRVIAFETSLEASYIREKLDDFERAGKVIYRDGIVWVINMRKYNGGSEKVEQRVQKDVDDIPDCWLKQVYLAYFNLGIPYAYGMDTIAYINEMNINEMNMQIPDQQQSYDEWPPICDPSTALRVFIDVTGMIMFPAKSRDDDIERICGIYAQKNSEIIDYLRPFYDEWVNRKYNRVNTSWLDWAVSGEIPKKRNDKPQEQPIEDQARAAGYTIR